MFELAFEGVGCTEIKRERERDDSQDRGHKDGQDQTLNPPPHGEAQHLRR
jgi:hypothetical protein